MHSRTIRCELSVPAEQRRRWWRRMRLGAGRFESVAVLFRRIAGPAECRVRHPPKQTVAEPQTLVGHPV